MRDESSGIKIERDAATPRRRRLPALAAALTTAGLLSLGQASATIIHDYDGNEPTNDDPSSATTTSTVSDEFQGCVGANCLDTLVPQPTGRNDPADYVGYSGLNSGATYTLSLQEFGVPNSINALDFSVFLNPSIPLPSPPDYFITLGPNVSTLVPQPTARNDPADYVGYSGLNSGATYTLSLQEFGIPNSINALDFSVFLNPSIPLPSPPDYFITLGPNVSTFTHDFQGLTGFTSLMVGVTFGTSNPGGCCEGYSIRLTQTQGPGTAPEPATVALVAAGLAGALVARRRRPR